MSASPSTARSTVLVTGGSGFVASHLIMQLLTAGHTVRATLRDLTKADAVRETLRAAGAGDQQQGQLSFVAADLGRDEGWPEAARGCDFVQHVAEAPVPPTADDGVITAAREGTLRVLRAAREAGVRRVVLASSFGAVAYGHGEREDGFDEGDWSVDGPGLPPPQRSKLLAERAAWDFIGAGAGLGPELELAVINTVGVLGPVLCAAHAASASVSIIAGLLRGAIPAVPRLSFNVVDVRDLAALHVLAMAHPGARHARFVACGPDAEPASLLDVARLVRAERPARAGRVPDRKMPDWAARALGAVSPAAAAVVRQLGVVRRVRGRKAAEVLGWTARARDEVVLATVDGLVKHGIV